MNASRRAQWLLAAAMAALPGMMIASSASAQYQSGQNGHALDANTQVNSGGQNTGGPSNSAAVTGNQIVTGNSTGGTFFRGPVPYNDPNTFDGPLASQGNDNFVRDSHGVPTPYSPSFSSYTPRAFYSASSLTAAPPPGYVNENFQNAVVNTGLAPAGGYNNTLSGLDALRSQNLGNTNVYGVGPDTLVNSVSTLPPPGVGESGLYTASPLFSSNLLNNAQTNSQTGEPLPFAVAQPQIPILPDRFSANQNGSDQFTNLYTSLTTNSTSSPNGNQPNQPGVSPTANPNGPANQLNPNMLAPTPLNNSLNPTQGGNPQYNDNTNPLAPTSPQAPSSMLNQQPMNTPLNPYGQTTGSNSLNVSTFNTSVATNQSSRQWLLVPPAQQSKQYRELQERLDQFNSTHQLTDQDAIRQFQQQQLAIKAAAGGGANANNPGGPIGPAPGAGGVNGGGGVPNPGQPGNTPLKPSDFGGAPLYITSLADGVRNATLRDLLSSAETLMKQDKFASAVEKYDTAIQLTNNGNPMILIGRANAELGSSFYAKAEQDIRRAVAGDPSVLMGRYDLTKMMDPKRIDFVRGDLETLNKDTKSVRVPLLLAYLEYNTGHEDAAQKYLAQAEDLVGNSDPIIELMRTHWSFQSPQMKPGGDLNK
jgi:tetratricopeptide (TPR) repeat protein